MQWNIGCMGKIPKKTGLPFGKHSESILCFITVKSKVIFSAIDRPGYVLCDTILMLLLIVTGVCGKMDDARDVNCG